MPTISETGHAVNVENFKILKDAVAGFGANYNPSNLRLQIANLTSRYEESLGRLDAVIETQVFLIAV